MEITSALSFNGSVCWWDEPFAGMFSGKVGSIETTADGIRLLCVSWKSTTFVAGFQDGIAGWQKRPWRSTDGTDGQIAARCYRDTLGSLWFCEWFEEEHRSLLWLDARRSMEVGRRAEGKTAWIKGGLEEHFVVTTNRAILRESEEGRELAISFDHQETPFEIHLKFLAEAGWIGTWGRGRRKSEGPFKARVLHDDKDLFVVGEWKDGGRALTVLVDLAFDRRVI